MSVCVRYPICVNIQVIVSEYERERVRKIVFQESTCSTSCVPLMKVPQLCLTLCDPIDYTVHGILQTRILEWSLSLLQGIFPIQGLNPGLAHCRRILYQLSHKGSPRILEWVAFHFSSGSSWPRNWTGVFCIAGRFFTTWTIREAPLPWAKRGLLLWQQDREHSLPWGWISFL